MYPAKF